MRWGHRCGTHVGANTYGVADAESGPDLYAGSDSDRGSCSPTLSDPDTESRGNARSDAGTHGHTCRSADFNAGGNARPEFNAESHTQRAAVCLSRSVR